MIEGPIVGVQRLARIAAEDREKVLQHVLDRGIAWLDTADVYGAATGEAETWLAPVARDVSVATKGGLRLEGTRMIPDGRAGSLTAAAERSRDRLEVDAIALWQWHAPDPAVSARSSLNAIAKLLDRGVVRAVGLCNTTVATLRSALDLFPVACVQVEVSPHRPVAVRSGVVEAAIARGVQVLAYRPLGGKDGVRRLRKDPVLREVADRVGARVEAVVLAWIRSLGMVPLTGPTTVEHVDLLLADPITLDPADLARVDAAFEPGQLLRTRRAARRPADDAPGDVVVMMGSPGSGKSTRARRLPGHLRLNRDDRGGTLADLAAPLAEALAAGRREVVLDNTYASRASRSLVVETAWKAGVPVRCEWLQTTDDDAEVNLVGRILDAVGRLPEPPELVKPPNPAVVPPRAIHRYRAELEPPELDEGFVRVDPIAFVRAPPAGDRRIVLVDPRDLTPTRSKELAVLAADGFAVVSIGWQPTDGADERKAVLERVVTGAARFGLDVHAYSCPHPAGPPVCWCRKPLPGLAVLALRALLADPARSVALGTQPADRSLARKLGIPLLSDR